MKKEKLINRVNPLFLKGIAHRGLWTEKLTENGLPAFENAVKNNMAIELDVHIAKDNVLIVCHDDDLKRTTGKPGIIEDLTSKQIKENYKLNDGSEVPTFQEVLALVNEQVPIVVELKVRNRNYKPLAKLVKQEMANIKDSKNFFMISFDPRALWNLKHIPFVTGLLVTPSHGWTYIFRNKFNSLDIDKEMIPLKKVQRYGKKKFLNVWTIESKEEFDKVYPYVDTVTFQKMDYNYVRDKLIEKNFK